MPGTPDPAALTHLGHVTPVRSVSAVQGRTRQLPVSGPDVRVLTRHLDGSFQPGIAGQVTPLPGQQAQQIAAGPVAYSAASVSGCTANAPHATPTYQRRASPSR